MKSCIKAAFDPTWYVSSTNETEYLAYCHGGLNLSTVDGKGSGHGRDQMMMKFAPTPVHTNEPTPHPTPTRNFRTAAQKFVAVAAVREEL
jgi:hypothetical protein